MWEPVGPLPASVYWRRRCTAVAVAVLLIGAAVWGAAVLLGPRGAGSTADGTTILAPSNVALSAPDPSAPQQGPSSSAVASGTTEPASIGSTPAATASEQLRPDVTPGRAIPVATPVPVPATGPVPCTNAMLDVTAEVDRPAYRVGEHPVLRLVMVNATDQPCVRDLDPARQEIVVWSGDGKTRLWSSNDCSPVAGVDLRTMVPAQPVVSAVTWAGKTSVPGCTGPRTVVPAGAYRVMTRLDDDISAPVPFLLGGSGS
ncbi:hypothetical protein ACQEVB_05630 [Pseudonocardia sp. CA-107938]|uniref:hypothetical protein n=1 Tax=Pseudonocardia sp. CA-107938 TaxID=3240021 RepID=UPI003D8C1B54